MSAGRGWARMCVAMVATFAVGCTSSGSSGRSASPQPSPADQTKVAAAPRPATGNSTPHRTRIVAYSGWHTVVDERGVFVQTGTLSYQRPRIGRVVVWWQGRRDASGSWQVLSTPGTGPLSILRRDVGARRLVLLDSHGFRHRLSITSDESVLSDAWGGRIAIPADALTQNAGACAGGRGRTVTIAANPDTPAPRCMEVAPRQGVRAVNRTGRFGQPGHTVRAAFAGQRTRLGVSESVVYRRGVGAYLAPGVHFLRFSWHRHTMSAAVWVRHLPVHRINVRRDTWPPPRIFAHLFYRFAHHPSVHTGPFDTPVSLGIGGRFVRTLSDDDRYDPAKWRMSALGYAEGSGPFSALRLLVDHARDAHVSNRPPPPCAEHVRPGGRLTGGGTLIRIQPRPHAVSCIEWWSVDLFVNDVGQVVGVNVNLGAP